MLAMIPYKLESTALALTSNTSLKPMPMETSVQPTLPLALVVDDNKDNREIFSWALEHAGYTVTLAVDGKDAITALAKQPFHLMILDLQMPELDGHGVLKIIHTQPELLPKHVIVATANAHMTPNGIDDLADYIIYKPIEVAALVTLAKRLQASVKNA